jgi:squalene monooxygenase
MTDTAAFPPLRDRYDVVIVGAGLAGCAVAQALSRADQRRRRSILIIDLHKQV